MLHVSARWVSQNLSAHDWHWRVASSQELLGSYTSDKELFCCRLVTGDKTWIYHWAPLSKLEFMQWKEVDRPTQICKSAINWLDYGNSFSGIHMDCSWQTICILERQLLVSITQNQRSSYSMSSNRNIVENCHLGVWLFLRQCATAQVIGCSASSLQLWICSTEAFCLQSRLGSQWLFANKKSEVPSSWNLVYRWWITDDRCWGMVWKSKQKTENSTFRA